MIVVDLFFLIEFLRNQSRRSWDEVLESFYHLVRGQAAECYWQFVWERPPKSGSIYGKRQWHGFQFATNKQI